MITWLIIGIIVFSATVFVWRYRQTKEHPTQESFFVADRKSGGAVGTLTLTANWFQAPATLLSGNQAYSGLANFLMFLVPNVFAMVLPGFMVDRIRTRVQEAKEKIYNIPQFGGLSFGPGVRFMFGVSAFGALIGAMSYTLSGLAQWLEPLGINAWQLALVMALTAYLWAFPRGIVGAIKGDLLKVAALAVIVIGALVVAALGWDHPGYASIPLRVVPDGTTIEWVFWTTGIALAISLIGGPICNPDLGERTYIGVRRSNYFGAAAFFGLGVIACGMLGFTAWHLGITPSQGQLATFALLESLTNQWVLYSVGFMLFIVLTAAFASMFASAADLLAVEFIGQWYPNLGDEVMIYWSRGLMIVPMILAAILASIPKDTVDLGTILLSLAVIRGLAIWPMLAAVFWPFVRRPLVFWGMVAALAGGLILTFGAPVWKFATGADVVFLATHGKPLGALWACFVPLLAMLPDLAPAWARRVSTWTARA